MNVRAMVDRSYELCLYRCNEDKEAVMIPCKQACFNKIQVPFRHASHVARDNEETSYRRCLAKSKNFPSLQQDDFMNCSNSLFAERIETLSTHIADEATRVFEIARS